jgi:hypothetical protein
MAGPSSCERLYVLSTTVTAYCSFLEVTAEAGPLQCVFHLRRRSIFAKHNVNCRKQPPGTTKALLARSIAQLG